jgi:hypothetical protein
VCRVFFIFKESFPGFARMRVSHEDWISLKGEGQILGPQFPTDDSRRQRRMLGHLLAESASCWKS